MNEIFDLSSEIIDSGSNPQNKPFNRITNKLSELTSEFAVIESFSHCIFLKTDAGFVMFDASSQATGTAVVEEFRRWSKERIDTMVYTHGHIDHIGGSGYFVEDAAARRLEAPKVVAHANVAARMERYQYTQGYNVLINERQFGAFRNRGYAMTDKGPHLPDNAAWPTQVYSDELAINVGGKDMTFFHGYGETDDHTWAWLPDTKTICAGDFFVWNFPNCGNPQKVQRYPREWAFQLRKMMSMKPEFFFPAHGLAIQGEARIQKVLEITASTLEKIVKETVEMMNMGAKLNDIVHTVKVDPTILEFPWMRPFYDEPEFVVNNIWRYYGGWYQGEPDKLKPSPTASLANEITDLVGSIDTIILRAEQLADDKDFRLACHLIEIAVNSQPDNLKAHESRANIYQSRRDSETSLMAKGIFSYEANASKDKLS